jgi:hypothetical protein
VGYGNGSFQSIFIPVMLGKDSLYIGTTMAHPGLFSSYYKNTDEQLAFVQVEEINF